PRRSRREAQEPRPRRSRLRRGPAPPRASAGPLARRLPPRPLHQARLARPGSALRGLVLRRFGLLRGPARFAALVHELLESVGELVEAIAADRGDRDELETVALGQGADLVLHRLRVREIHLVQDDEARLLEERRRIRAE